MRRQAGFTMIELMIGLVVLAILVAGALPAFTTFIQNNRLAAQANELVAATQLARSEALKRGVNVAVCSSSGGTTCDGGDFTEGWVVVANPGGGADEELIQRWPSPGDDFQFTPDAGRAEFNPEGFSTSNVELQLDLVLEDCSNDSARRILVERTGRVSSQRINCPT